MYKIVSQDLINEIENSDLDQETKQSLIEQYKDSSFNNQEEINLYEKNLKFYEQYEYIKHRDLSITCIIQGIPKRFTKDNLLDDTIIVTNRRCISYRCKDFDGFSYISFKIKEGKLTNLRASSKKTFLSYDNCKQLINTLSKENPNKVFFMES